MYLNISPLVIIPWAWPENGFVTMMCRKCKARNLARTFGKKSN